MGSQLIHLRHVFGTSLYSRKTDIDVVSLVLFSYPIVLLVFSKEDKISNYSHWLRLQGIRAIFSPKFCPFPENPCSQAGSWPLTGWVVPAEQRDGAAVQLPAQTVGHSHSLRRSLCIIRIMPEHSSPLSISRLDASFQKWNRTDLPESSDTTRWILEMKGDLGTPSWWMVGWIG